MKRSKSNKSAKIVMIIFALIILLLSVNVAYLGITGKHLVNGEDFLAFSKKLGSGQKTDILYAKRGTIYSSDNAIIASDVKKYKLIAFLNETRTGIKTVPAYVQDKYKEECAKDLSEIIGMDQEEILNLLNSDVEKVDFGEYGDNLPEGKKEKIEELDYTGLKFEENKDGTYKLTAVLDQSKTTTKNVPAYVQDKEECAEKLSKIIGMDKAKILERLNSKTENGNYVYQVEFGSYGSNLSSIVKAQIEELDITGLEFEEVTTRNYRFGDFASYEVGYAKVSTENNINTIIGEMGIEKLYNDELTGTNGSRVYLADNNGNTLPNGVISETSPIAGNDIYLTINSELQTELDMQLQSLGDELNVTKATCGIMEAKTGKILAVSNYPSFDPNKRDFTNYTDIFFSDAIEPGSVFKPFVYANALNDGVLDLSKYYQSGKFQYSSKVVIKDHNNGVGWGSITYEEGFYHSSNTAICSILTNYTNKESLIEDYKDLGFFQSSTIDRIESSAGISGYSRSNATQLEYLTTGYGQGSTMTAVQLLRAYSVFANDGKTVEPYLVDKIVNSETNETIYEGKSQYSKQIFSSSTIKTMKSLLNGVINKEGSTGYIYHMDDLELIGKTGTGQIAEDGAYSSSKHTHSFSGLAPYDDPQVVIVLWYQCNDSDEDASVRADFVKTMSKAAVNLLNEQPSKEVKTSSYTLDSYINQSVSYTKNILSSHSLTPIVISNGSTVTAQYPAAKTVMTTDSRVFISTDGSKITMPSMIGWSRKEAEAFASMAGVKIEYDGVGIIYEQSVSKGKTLKQDQTITVKAK